MLGVRVRSWRPGIDLPLLNGCVIVACLFPRKARCLAAASYTGEYPLPDPRQQEHASQRCDIRTPQHTEGGDRHCGYLTIPWRPNRTPGRQPVSVVRSYIPLGILRQVVAYPEFAEAHETVERWK